MEETEMQKDNPKSIEGKIENTIQELETQIHYLQWELDEAKTELYDELNQVYNPNNNSIFEDKVLTQETIDNLIKNIDHIPPVDLMFLFEHKTFRPMMITNSSRLRQSQLRFIFLEIKFKKLKRKLADLDEEYSLGQISENTKEQKEQSSESKEEQEIGDKNEQKELNFGIEEVSNHLPSIHKTRIKNTCKIGEVLNESKPLKPCSTEKLKTKQNSGESKKEAHIKTYKNSYSSLFDLSMNSKYSLSPDNEIFKIKSTRKAREVKLPDSKPAIRKKKIVLDKYFTIAQLENDDLIWKDKSQDN